jgi:hypothetical protein
MKSATNSPSELVPIDELDQAIVDLSACINASTYELLVLIREFEDRAGYLKWGLKDAAEWLAYRCDLGRSAAYEKVRVARALRTLPAISECFSTGELSYSKVRALTRVASDHNEQELLDFALRTTAVRVEGAVGNYVLVTMRRLMWQAVLTRIAHCDSVEIRTAAR